MFDDYNDGIWRLNGKFFHGWAAAMNHLRSEGWSFLDAGRYLRALK